MTSRRVTLQPIGFCPRSDAVHAGNSGVVIEMIHDGEAIVRLDNGNVTSWPVKRMVDEVRSNVIHVQFRRAAA